MRSLVMLIMIAGLSTIASAQPFKEETGGFVSFLYGHVGNFKYFADVDEYDGDVYTGSFEYYTKTENTMNIGFQLTPASYLVLGLGINRDSYEFTNGADETAKFSFTGIQPYIGYRHYFQLQKGVFSYFELGGSKRFVSVDSDKFYYEEYEKEITSMIEDINSILRFGVELGIDYNFYEHISIGMSTKFYHESLSGDMFHIDYRGDTYKTEFDESRIGQYYNLKLTIFY